MGQYYQFTATCDDDRFGYTCPIKCNNKQWGDITATVIADRIFEGDKHMIKGQLVKYVYTMKNKIKTIKSVKVIKEYQKPSNNIKRISLEEMYYKKH